MKKRMMMAIVLIQLLAFAAHAQEKKIRKYCEISFTGGFFGGGTKLYYGQNRRYTPLTDSAYVRKLKNVESMSGRVSILNYMSKMGWTYVETSNFKGDPVSILFSKEFDPSELDPSEVE